MILSQNFGEPTTLLFYCKGDLSKMTEPKLGQVILTTSAHGSQIDKAEMLLLPKAQLNLEYKDNKILMNVADTDILTDNLSGTLDLDTVNDMIKVLCRMRNQLQNGGIN